MNIIFLSVSTAISDITNRGIYPDLLRYFAAEGHKVFIVCPFERRLKRKTQLTILNNVYTLGVQTLNITKSNVLEKGLATILLESQYSIAIEKYFKNEKFDLILYTTPPITLNGVISKLKRKHGAKTYLMLKDIFPQNAVDLGLIRSKGILNKYFKDKEETLYRISDHIGCMSLANKEYLINNHPNIPQEKIGICPNAIEVVPRIPNSRDEILNKFGIPNDRPIFIYGGNLGIAQGIEFLLNVLDKFKDSNSCFFLIVGSGNKSHLIANWVRKYKPNNILHIPMLNRIEYDELEACCDIGMIFLDYRFTIPNFPSRMLAYLECKLPLLLATDPNSDIGKIAEENGFGKWSLSNNLNSIANHIEFFIANPKIRKSMGEKGYDYLIKNYHVSNAYDSIMKSISN